jgi:hypothetical protein
VIDPTLGWNPLKSLVKVVKKVALPAAMFATKFLPGGIIVSTAAKLALSAAGAPRTSAAIPSFAVRSGFARRLQDRAAAIRAATATPMTQVSPAIAANMAISPPTMSAQSVPVSESQVAQAAASESASVAAAGIGAGPILPLLLLGGAALLLLRKGR